MKKPDKIQVVFAVLTVAVMVVIFMFSCEDADDSSETSGFFVNFIISTFYKGFDSLTELQQSEILDRITHIIRKTAHFSVYTALGFCSSFAVGKKKLLSLKSLCTVGFCFLYACSDEIHQYFVPGRACMFTDVLIDTSGGITGLAISALVLAIVTKKCCAE